MPATSFYTGPTIVGQIAAKFREAGFTVTCEGTAHVWVECPAVGPIPSAPASEGAGEQASPYEQIRRQREGILAKLREVHGTSFGLN